MGDEDGGDVALVGLLLDAHAALGDDPTSADAAALLARICAPPGVARRPVALTSALTYGTIGPRRPHPRAPRCNSN